MTRAPVRRFHPLVWPLWLAGAAFSVGTNPLHNLLLLLGAALVAVVCRSDSPVGRAFGLFVRIGLVVIALRVAFSAVAVGDFVYGATPLGRLPRAQMPVWLGGLALGGPFTLEMVTSGLVSGIRLLTILAVFGAFNSVADHYGLLRRTPSFLGGAGLAVTLALAFVPQTLQQLAAIREAQRVRGHRFHGWRDAIPLLVPLISGGIERSLQLAEAMDSRGYGARRHGSRRRPVGEQIGALVGLALLMIGLFMLFYAPSPVAGLVEMAAGGAVLAAVAYSLGRANRRSRYLRERWGAADRIVVGSSVALLAGAYVTRRYLAAALDYSAFPRATLPAAEPVSIALMFLLIVPALLALLSPSRTARAVPLEPAPLGR